MKSKIRKLIPKTFPKIIQILMKIQNGTMIWINIKKQIQNQKKALLWSTSKLGGGSANKVYMVLTIKDKRWSHGI